jgi:hypothetical protein
MKRVVCMMRHRPIKANGFRNMPPIGAAPTVHLERAREQARLRTRQIKIKLLYKNFLKFEVKFGEVNFDLTHSK